MRPCLSRSARTLCRRTRASGVLPDRPLCVRPLPARTMPRASDSAIGLGATGIPVAISEMGRPARNNTEGAPLFVVFPHNVAILWCGSTCCANELGSGDEQELSWRLHGAREMYPPILPFQSWLNIPARAENTVGTARNQDIIAWATSQREGQGGRRLHFTSKVGTTRQNHGNLEYIRLPNQVLTLTPCDTTHEISLHPPMPGGRRACPSQHNACLGRRLGVPLLSTGPHELVLQRDVAQQHLAPTPDILKLMSTTTRKRCFTNRRSPHIQRDTGSRPYANTPRRLHHRPTKHSSIKACAQQRDQMHIDMRPGEEATRR